MESYATSSTTTGLAYLLELSRHFAQCFGSRTKCDVGFGYEPLTAAVGTPTHQLTRPCVLEMHTDITMPGPRIGQGHAAIGPGVIIRQPAMRRLHVSMRSDQDSGPVACDITLAISYSDETLTLVSCHDPQGLKQLLTDLSSNVCHVVEQVTGGMVFEQLETAGKYISEALLRVVRQDSRLASVSYVRVNLDARRIGGSNCVSDAFWRTELVDSKVTADSPAAQPSRNQDAGRLPLPKAESEAERASKYNSNHAPVVPSWMSESGNTTEKTQRDSTRVPVASERGGVFVALGSNMGDRLDAIEAACRAIDADGDMSIINTSFLYETTAMYVEDQASFLNAVCEVGSPLHTQTEMYVSQNVRRY